MRWLMGRGGAGVQLSLPADTARSALTRFRIEWYNARCALTRGRERHGVGRKPGGRRGMRQIERVDRALVVATETSDTETRLALSFVIPVLNEVESVGLL